jgi:hypothetical protein
MQPAQDALAKLQATLATQVAGSTQAAESRVAQAMPVVQQPIAPGAQPVAPQPTWVVPQQYSYPPTIQAPAVNSQGSTPPRYLPPVASRPGELRR